MLYKQNNSLIYSIRECYLVGKSPNHAEVALISMNATYKAGYSNL